MCRTEGINRRALFSDETADYLCPMVPYAGGVVRIRFRSAKQYLDSVYLVDGGGGRQEMRPVSGEEQSVFTFYETEFSLSEEPYRYCFQVAKVDEVC